jgi:hypothetical protein
MNAGTSPSSPRVVRAAQTRNGDRIAQRIVRAWRTAAKAGMALPDAAALIGRDVEEGRAVAENRFRFAPRDRLPAMSAADAATYRKMRRHGVGRVEALHTLGLIGGARHG